MSANREDDDLIHCYAQAYGYSAKLLYFCKESLPAIMFSHLLLSINGGTCQLQ